MTTSIIAHLVVLMLAFSILFEIYKITGNILLGLHAISAEKRFRTNFLTANTVMMPILVTLVVYFWA